MIDASLYITEKCMVALSDLPMGGPGAVQVERIEGLLEAPEVRSFDTPVAFRHGMVGGYDTLSGRTIFIEGDITASPTQTFTEAVEEFLAKTKPSRGYEEQQFSFWFDELADGEKATVFCRVRDRQLDGLDDDTLGGYTRFRLRLETTSPYIFSATTTTDPVLPVIIGALPGVTFPTAGGGITFPTAGGNTVFATATPSQQTVFSISGTEDIDTWVCTITASGGDLVNPAIRNNTEGEYIEFSGLTLSDGESVIIDAANRTIKRNNGISQYHLITSTSSWFCMCAGSNLMEFDYDSDAGSATCEMSYRQHYI
jgi:hypothetical protein